MYIFGLYSLRGLSHLGNVAMVGRRAAIEQEQQLPSDFNRGEWIVPGFDRFSHRLRLMEFTKNRNSKILLHGTLTFEWWSTTARALGVLGGPIVFSGSFQPD